MAYDGEIRINTKLNTETLNTDLSNMSAQIGKALGGINISTAGMTAGLIAIGKQSFEAGSSFESAFAGVIKTVDATDIELAQMREQFRGLSMDIPITANELAGIGEAAGQLGIANENILGFTETMANLGVATNMTAEQAAVEFARFANIVQLPQENIDRLGSTIVALGNNLATTEAEISSMSLRLAGAGSQAGLTAAEIYGFAGALSSVGIEAEAGGTAFSKVFTEINLAVAKGGTELENFARVAGMSTSQFAQAFGEDAAGAITAFVTGLADVERNGMSAIQILDEIGISEIRMRDALLRASGAGELFANSINLANEAWEQNSALTDEASKRYETMDSQLQLLENSMTNLGISVYDSLREPLAASVSVLRSVVDGFNELPAPVIEFTSRAGAMAAVLGTGYTAFKAITAAKEIYAAITAKTATQEAATLTTTNNLSAAQTAQIASITRLTAAQLAEAQAVLSVAKAQEQQAISSSKMSATKQAESAQSLKILQALQQEAAANLQLIEAQNARALSSNKVTIAAEQQAAQAVKNATANVQEAQAEMTLLQAQNAREAVSARLVLAKEAQAKATLEATIAENEFNAAQIYGTGIMDTYAADYYALTLAKEKAAIATAQVVALEAEEAAATVAATGVKATQTVTTEINTAANAANALSIKGITAAMMSNPLFMIGATLAIPAIITLVDSLNNSYERQIETISKLSSEYTAFESQIKDIEGKISTIGERINEIKELGPTQVTDPDELPRLEALNEGLHVQLELLEKQAAIKQSEIVTETSKAINALTNEINNQIDARNRWQIALEENNISELESLSASRDAMISAEEFSAALVDKGAALIELRNKLTGNTEAEVDLKASIDETLLSINESTPAIEKNKDIMADAEAETTRLTESKSKLAEQETINAEATKISAEAQEKIVEAYKTAREDAKTLTDIQKTLSKSLNIDTKTLDEILDLYPEAIVYANDLAGMQEFLAGKIEDANIIHQQAMADMIFNNAETIHAMINKHSDLPESIAKYYNIDSENFAKTANGKYKVEAQVVADLSALWAKYAGVSAESIDRQLAGIGMAMGRMKEITPEMRQQYNELKLISDLQKAAAKEYEEFVTTERPPPKSSSAAKEAIDEALKAEVESLKKRQELREIDEAEFNEHLQRMLERQGLNAKDRQYLDDELHKSTVKLINEEEKATTERLKNEVKFLDDRKKLNEISERDVYNSLQNMLNSYELNASDRLYLEDELTKSKIKLAEESRKAQVEEIEKNFDAEKERINDIKDLLKDKSYESIEIQGKESTERLNIISNEYYDRIKWIEDETSAYSKAENEKMSLFAESQRIIADGLNEELNARLEILMVTNTALYNEIMALKARNDEIKKGQQARREEKRERQEAAKLEELYGKLAVAEGDDQIKIQKEINDLLEAQAERELEKAEQSEIEENNIRIRDAQSEINDNLKEAKELTKSYNEDVEKLVANFVKMLEIGEAGGITIPISLKGIEETKATLIEGVGEQTAGEAIGEEKTSAIVTAAGADKQTVAKMLSDTETIIKAFEDPLSNASKELTDAIYDVTDKGLTKWHDDMKISIKNTYDMIEYEMQETLKMVEDLARKIFGAQRKSYISAAEFGVDMSLINPLPNDRISESTTNVINQYFTVQPETTAYSAAREAERALTMGGDFR